jgi:RNA recognition motif-containing protein
VTGACPRCITLKGAKEVAAINIYVGNLSFKTNEEHLRELFETYGQVESATIISDKFTGRPRGFGFVKMPEREEGLKAIQNLDSKDFMGRNIKVNEAQPRNDRMDSKQNNRGPRWR